MIIPSKHSGYQAGIRLYPGGGGGGGAPAETAVQAPAAPTTVAPPPNAWDKSAVNTQQGYNTLQSMKGIPWEKAGTAYNELLNQGFTSDQIKSAATDMYGKPSESNWTGMVQNAGMNSPTGRPMAGSDQFYQPIYKSNYQNYARPATQFDTSMYGTQPVYSPARAWNDRNAGSAAAGQQVVNNAIGNYFQQNPNSDINSTLKNMRDVGINRTDIQSWGGVNNYGPQTSMYQQPVPFNPYTNSSGYGGYMPQMQNPYMQQQQNYYPPQQQYGYSQPFMAQSRQPTYAPPPPIVGRSSQMRGTPNVMRRAEGGITSLLDQDE